MRGGPAIHRVLGPAVLGEHGDVEGHGGRCYPRVVDTHAKRAVAKEHMELCPSFGHDGVDGDGVEGERDGQGCRGGTFAGPIWRLCVAKVARRWSSLRWSRIVTARHRVPRDTRRGHRPASESSERCGSWTHAFGAMTAEITPPGSSTSSAAESAALVWRSLLSAARGGLSRRHAHRSDPAVAWAVLPGPARAGLPRPRRAYQRRAASGVEPSGMTNPVRHGLAEVGRGEHFDIRP